MKYNLTDITEYYGADYMSCIDTKTLKELFKNMPEIKANINYKIFNIWKEIWENKLTNLYDDSVVISPNYLIEHIFPLKYDNFFNYNIEIDIYVDELLRGINRKHINFQQINLSKILPILWYTKYDSLMYEENHSSSPIIAVFFPAQVGSSPSLQYYSILDGNHRVSAAVNSHKDLPIYCILDPFLKSKYFINLVSCYAFHLIQSYLYLQLNDDKVCIQYLKELNSFNF